ncbi:ABC transporter permease [Paenibacillus koleovorans]|uniref:ABC transporter permease n=1 Tax=Paenibacillus koleovorans TaxID=121608 RepID=UPI001C3F7D3F|nr:ABC transporter permease subunit [Paenibacillus koleovorans]
MRTSEMNAISAGMETGRSHAFLMKRIRKMWLLYAMLVPALILVALFNYIPMYGVLIAFKTFRVADGIWGSTWNDFEHFRTLFSTVGFTRALRNTVIISLLRLVFGFPMPILFALLINEMRNGWFKKTVQSISYLPHFISWVVLAGIVGEILSPQRGVLNYLIQLAGGKPIYFLISNDWFRSILIATDIWKDVGWSAIIYIAALASIDPQLYEAADMDGASRLRKAWHISIPGIVPMIVILFLIKIGHVLNSGFDQIFNLYNPLVYETGDVLDTFIYRIGILNARYDFSTAVGLFMNAIGILLLLGSNMIIRRKSEYGIW